MIENLLVEQITCILGVNRANCDTSTKIGIGHLYGHYVVERGSSMVECRTRNQVSPGSNPALLPFRKLGIFVLSIDAPVDSAV